MTDDEVRRSIDELERALTRQAIEEIEEGLAHDDPSFVQHIHRCARAEIATAVAVCVLVAAGAVLVTVGLATASWLLWLAGVLAFLASFGANALHDRTLNRTPFRP